MEEIKSQDVMLLTNDERVRQAEEAVADVANKGEQRTIVADEGYRRAWKGMSDGSRHNQN